MRKSATVPPEYFEEKYKADIDPWQFRTSGYERAKYRATLGSLTRKSYAAALEVGCSIGVLTQLLSRRCVSLLAIDACNGIRRFFCDSPPPLAKLIVVIGQDLEAGYCFPCSQYT